MTLSNVVVDTMAGLKFIQFSYKVDFSFLREPNHIRDSRDPCCVCLSVICPCRALPPCRRPRRHRSPTLCSWWKMRICFGGRWSLLSGPSRSLWCRRSSFYWGGKNRKSESFLWTVREIWLTCDVHIRHWNDVCVGGYRQFKGSAMNKLHGNKELL